MCLKKTELHTQNVLPFSRSILDIIEETYISIKWLKNVYFIHE